jgi:hypothetical protein
MMSWSEKTGTRRKWRRMVEDGELARKTSNLQMAAMPAATIYGSASSKKSSVRAAGTY